MIYSERRSDEFLFVKTLSGKTFKVDYNPAYLVQFVKDMIKDKDGITTHLQSFNIWRCKTGWGFYYAARVRYCKGIYSAFDALLRRRHAELH